MRTIDISIVTEANYTLYQMDDNIVYLEAYEELQTLFRQCKSAFIRVGECSVPYYWAPAIVEALDKIVEIDPKIVVVNIKEENSKLVLDFWCPSKAEEIRDIVHQVKNDIDQLVHDRVRKMLVQRKFNYVPEGFHQLIPDQHCRR